MNIISKSKFVDWLISTSFKYKNTSPNFWMFALKRKSYTRTHYIFSIRLMRQLLTALKRSTSAACFFRSLSASLPSSLLLLLPLLIVFPERAQTKTKHSIINQQNAESEGESGNDGGWETESVRMFCTINRAALTELGHWNTSNAHQMLIKHTATASSPSGTTGEQKREQEVRQGLKEYGLHAFIPGGYLSGNPQLT